MEPGLTFPLQRFPGMKPPCRGAGFDGLGTGLCRMAPVLRAHER